MHVSCDDHVHDCPTLAVTVDALREENARLEGLILDWWDAPEGKTGETATALCIEGRRIRAQREAARLERLILDWYEGIPGDPAATNATAIRLASEARRIADCVHGERG